MFKWFECGDVSKAIKALNRAETTKPIEKPIKVKKWDWEVSRVYFNRMYREPRQRAVKPLTKELHLGIEIECIYPRRKQQALLKALYPYTKYLTWSDDGSISAHDMDMNTVEFKVCFPISKPYILKNILTILKRCRAYTNSTCGTHVHIDMRGKDVNKVCRIANNLTNIICSWRTLLPRHRVQNRFARMVTSFGYIRDSGDRYCAINLQSYRMHKTLEIRSLEGTLDFYTIWNWCKFLLILCSNSDLEISYTLQGLLHQVNFPKSVKTFLQKRSKSYKLNADLII